MNRWRVEAEELQKRMKELNVITVKKQSSIRKSMCNGNNSSVTTPIVETPEQYRYCHQSESEGVRLRKESLENSSRIAQNDRRREQRRRLRLKSLHLNEERYEPSGNICQMQMNPSPSPDFSSDEVIMEARKRLSEYTFSNNVSGGICAICNRIKNSSELRVIKIREGVGFCMQCV